MSIDQIIKAFGGVTNAAAALGVTRQTIYNWRRRGEIPKAREMQAIALLRGVAGDG